MNNHSGERITDTHIYFWNGVFSQWHISPFTIGNDGYNCAEQYMMAMKAEHFKDSQILNEIMSERSPRAQKAWGRKIRGFSDESWDKVKYDHVFDGTWWKFTKNPELKAKLLATGKKTIVEASPYDKIWGVGLHFDDDDILDESKWQGENLLGEALMEIRDILAAPKMKIQSAKEFTDSLSPEVKAQAQAMYDKFMGPHEGMEPLLCGPEARAQAKGPEALAAYYKEGEKYMKPISTRNWK